jgi:hypothetical protein
VLQYYWLLRSVLRSNPEARRCRCRHCRIFFITDPRNAGRQDLRWPFGCSQAHRKRESTRRSVDYYRSPEGKLKKRIQNSRRRRQVPAEQQPPEAPAQQAATPQASWPTSIVEHVRTLSTFIEARPVTTDEVIEMLYNVLRQHSMVRRRKVDHIVNQLHQAPP